MWRPLYPNSYHQVRSTSRLPWIRPLKYIAGYEKNEKTFQETVEREAIEFKPIGSKIHSYVRASPSSRGKGKEVASTIHLDPESEDVIEYEVYHVGICFPLAVSVFLKLTLGSVHVGHPGI